MDLCSQVDVGSFASLSGERAAPSTSAARYESMPAWGARHWEAAETTRLNQAHWQHAQDTPINQWLAEHLATLRARSTYESRQNGIVAGMQETHADDIVGPEGPTLQVESNDDAYNTAAETVWKDWFAAPTVRRNVSGPALLKLWIRNLWRCGEFLSRLTTDPAAEGPVRLRLWPAHPRRLATPAELTGDPQTTMGIRFDAWGRPATYYIADQPINGQSLTLASHPWPADLILHEFLLDEEDQARGFPWLTPGLSAAADLRDYEDQVHDAARQQADQCGMLYTEADDAEVWKIPESTAVERRTWKMAPPKWKPFVYPATQPPVQFPPYRGEKLRDIGRARSVPLLLIRMDASGHNYSSARIDTQSYDRSVEGLQGWLGGTEQSYGTLNRLVDEVLQEARFSVPLLRRRPARVVYRWTWPRRPHVDPLKEANADAVELGSGTLSLTQALAARGVTLEAHIATLARERKLLTEAGLPIPEWMQIAIAGQQLAALDKTTEEKPSGTATA